MVVLRHVFVECLGGAATAWRRYLGGPNGGAPGWGLGHRCQDTPGAGLSGWAEED
jgi:hypothetical protein